MTIGNRIKYRRIELGLSAEYLADKLSVSPSTIYRYEKGDIEKLPGSILEPLSQLLHTTPAFLMGWADDGPSPAQTATVPVENYTSEEKRLVRSWRIADDDTKENVAFMLRNQGMYIDKTEKAEKKDA